MSNSIQLHKSCAATAADLTFKLLLWLWYIAQLLIPQHYAMRAGVLTRMQPRSPLVLTVSAVPVLSWRVLAVDPERSSAWQPDTAGHAQ